MTKSHLISRSILFGNPVKSSPQLSPDGKYLAFLAPDDRDVLQVWLQQVGQETARCLTADKKRGIRSYFWTYLPDTLIYMQDLDGDENFHPYLVNVQSGEARDLTPFPQVRTEVVGLEEKCPNEILLAINKEDPKKHDVYRLHLQTGSMERVAENPGNIIGWCADRKLDVRAALSALADGGHDLLLKEAEGWKTLRHFGPDESGSPVEFSLDGKTLYCLSTLGANAQRLIAVDLASNQENVIAEDTQYDVEGVLTHPQSGDIRAVSFYKDQLTWQILSKDVAADFEFLKKQDRGEIRIGSQTLDDTQWIVSYLKDNGPVSYYLYHRAAHQMNFLFDHQPKLKELPLVEMKPISFASRDGLRLHGYLSGRRDGLHPTVLLVHGGPWARDKWGFSPLVQLLANRGYAVLQMNYRGSTGFGKAFLNAGDRQWARAMHDDLLDAVNWLIQEKISDPQKIAIMGGSYGGYATLVGLAMTPDVFACGIDIVGPSNLKTLIETIPPYWAPMLASFRKRVGDLDDDAYLKERSPLYFAHQIKKPLLIAQGANDPRVKVSESDQIVAAMRKANLPVQYWVYTDEGHGFARPENKFHFYARVESFLAEHLGGAAEPPQDAPGHSAQSR